MKRNDIEAKAKELGLESVPKELLDYIMNENGKDINSTKDSYTSIVAEHEAQKASITDLETKLAGFEDYDDLKAKVQNYENEKVNSLRSTYLSSLGCEAPELLTDKIDWNKAKYDDSKKAFTGIEDDVKNIKEKYSKLFAVEDDNNAYKGPSMHKQKEDAGKVPTMEDLRSL